jgi:hypothetical protein
MFTYFLTTLSHASHTVLREINMFNNNFMSTLSPHTTNRLYSLWILLDLDFTLYLSQEMNKHLKFRIHRRTT